MNPKRAVLRILGIMVLFISIGWYGRMGKIYEHVVVDTEEHSLSYDEAKVQLAPPIYYGKKYFYQNVTTVTYSQTLIPFKYLKGEIIKSKNYYNRK
jgi:hypothetical protein